MLLLAKTISRIFYNNPQLWRPTKTRHFITAFLKEPAPHAKSSTPTCILLLVLLKAMNWAGRGVGQTACVWSGNGTRYEDIPTIMIKFPRTPVPVWVRFWFGPNKPSNCNWSFDWKKSFTHNTNYNIYNICFERFSFKKYLAIREKMCSLA